MKSVIKLIMTIFMSLCLIFSLFYTITSGNTTFDDTYQSVIQRKFELLKNTNESKIIIVGGSSAGFGIDSELLEKESGYKVVNMGLHAAFGNLFNTEIIKSNINKGDIVVLAYEYTLNNDCFEKLGSVDLIMSGIDNYTEIYKTIPIINKKEVIGNIFNYARKKYTYVKNEVTNTVYSATAFDDNGNMIYKREINSLQDYDERIDFYGYVDMTKQNITDNNILYLRKLKKYIENKGATVCFSFPPIYEKAISESNKDFHNYIEYIEKTGIKCISDPRDYIFSDTYMYDTIYHCNDKGEYERTKQLIDDLKQGGFIYE